MFFLVQGIQTDNEPVQIVYAFVLFLQQCTVCVYKYRIIGHFPPCSEYLRKVFTKKRLSTSNIQDTAIPSDGSNDLQYVFSRQIFAFEVRILLLVAVVAELATQVAFIGDKINEAHGKEI
jgi:hypothetical protein